MAYVIARSSILLAITGLGYTMVGEVDLSSISISASQESAMGLSGSLKVKGELFVLNGTKADLITDWTNMDYDTFTDASGAITSAVAASGSKYARSNALAIADDGVYKCAVFLTLISGEAPLIILTDSTVSNLSNAVTLVAGLNIVTLTATGTDAAGFLKITNTAATNYATSKVYLWKQA
jgi:hypothetical protein